MKLNSRTFLALSAVCAFLAASPARAQTVDDVNWINKCIADNKDEGQTRPVLVSYCTCMNNEMSSSETKSITAWEKTHKKEADACSKKAGWKG
jgi:murein L,D-transpeptidase YafK